MLFSSPPPFQKWGFDAKTDRFTFSCTLPCPPHVWLQTVKLSHLLATCFSNNWHFDLQMVMCHTGLNPSLELGITHFQLFATVYSIRLQLLSNMDTNGKLRVILSSMSYHRYKLVCSHLFTLYACTTSNIKRQLKYETSFFKFCYPKNIFVVETGSWRPAAILLPDTQPHSACLSFIDRHCVNWMLNININ